MVQGADRKGFHLDKLLGTISAVNKSPDRDREAEFRIQNERLEMFDKLGVSSAWCHKIEK